MFELTTSDLIRCRCKSDSTQVTRKSARRKSTLSGTNYSNKILLRKSPKTFRSTSGSPDETCWLIYYRSNSPPFKRKMKCKHENGIFLARWKFLDPVRGVITQIATLSFENYFPWEWVGSYELFGKLRQSRLKVDEKLLNLCWHLFKL